MRMFKNVSMHMGDYFYFPTDLRNFLYEGLQFKGNGGVLGVCVLMFCITILLEASRAVMFYFQLRLRQNPLTYGQTDTSLNHDRSSLFSALMIPSSIVLIRRQRIKFHIGSYFVHTLNLILGYLLMLAVMSYDVYILVAVILGSGVGYFVFGAINAWNKAKFYMMQINVYDSDSQLAVAHGFRHVDSQAKAEWLVFAIDQWFSDNGISMICGYFKLCEDGNVAELQERLDKLPQAPMQQCHHQQANEDDDAEEDSNSHQGPPTLTYPTQSTSHHQDSENIDVEETDEGWTFVGRKGKKP